MAVTYDSSNDTYSMTFTDFESWLPNQSANTINTPYNVFITEVDASNCRGNNNGTLEHTFQYVLRNNATKYVSLSLTSDTSGIASVTNARTMFFSCSNLISVDLSGMSAVKFTSTMFANCSNLKSVDLSGMSAVIEADSMFGHCTSLISVDLSEMTAVEDAYGMFFYCTNLKSVDLSGMTAVIEADSMFGHCTSLTVISNLPYNISGNITYSSIFYDATSLYNMGIIRNLNIGRNDRIYGTNIKAVGVLISSLSAYDLQDWNGTKFYTTSQYYNGLRTELATNYPSKNFQVIKVDACLDFNELEDWLNSQSQNTADTPYKIFIGGGLSADRVKGAMGIERATPSELSNIIMTYGKYVDLSSIQLPSDCTDLTCALSGINTNSVQNYITAFCEIPSSVTKMDYFAYYARNLKSIGSNNEIPSTVISARGAFWACDIPKVIVNHQITNNMDYTDFIILDMDDLDNNVHFICKLYAKDYTYFAEDLLKREEGGREIRIGTQNLILECDYSDLNTYLGWFRISWKDVCLKVNGLIASDLIGDSSQHYHCALGECLLGDNIQDSQIKNYIINSTFDLRLTEIPSSIISLDYSFTSVNISYSFLIPNNVSSMIATFSGTSLKESPVLPISLINMNNCFSGTNFLTPPLIPINVTNMEGAFYRAKITEMPNIPIGVTSLRSSFAYTDIAVSNEIPSSVTNMEYCFCGCTSLEEVANVPSSVSALSNCFYDCTSLETINGWGVDVNNATMSNCFTGCTSLTEINTTTKETTNYDKWVHITVKTDTTDNTKYNLTLRTLATKTQPAQTLTIQVPKDVIYSYLTDEIMFSPSGTLSDSYITDMLNYKYPFGGGLDPSRKNFVLWAAQGSVVKQNLSSQSGFTGSDINVSNNNNTKIASIIGKYTGEVIPTGTMFIYGGSTAPSGWLLCDGSAISRSTYAELFSIIGTSYGVGDGSTTFNLPDMRDRFAQGASTSNPIGTKLEAGLPNITGQLNASRSWTANKDEGSGSFNWGANSAIYGSNVGSKYGCIAWGGGTGYTSVNIDASKSNSIYGSSDTVQPPAVCMNYIIKY